MKIKCLLVMPRSEVQIVKLSPNIKFIKALIGQNLLRIRLSENTILIGNKDARLDEFNRIVGEDIILGTFLIISIKNNRRVSMKKKDIRKYRNMFKLRKHQRKIELYREEYLEQFYTKQRELKLENAKRNIEKIFRAA